MSDVSNGIFSDHCYNQMWELFKTPEDEVGSKIDERYWAGRSPTNCIIYVSKVLIYGHEKIGRSDRHDEIRRLGLKLGDGSKLANYLVRTVGWNAHYWNPDVREPRDKKSEHPASYKDVLKEKIYLSNSSNLPISGLIVDYNKTTKKDTSKTIWTSIPVPILPIAIPFPTLLRYLTKTPQYLKRYQKLNLPLVLLVEELTLFCFHTEKFLKFIGLMKEQNCMARWHSRIMSGCLEH